MREKKQQKQKQQNIRRKVKKKKKKRNTELQFDCLQYFSNFKTRTSFVSPYLNLVWD